MQARTRARCAPYGAYPSPEPSPTRARGSENAREFVIRAPENPLQIFPSPLAGEGWGEGEQFGNVFESAS